MARGLLVQGWAMDFGKIEFGRATCAQLALLVLAAAVYGAVLGAWRSPLMSAYVAAKLPLVFLGTTLFVSPFCWMASLLTGSGLRFRDVVAAAFAAMSTAGAVLLALAPVVLFFVLAAAPDAGTRAELRFAHALLMLTHILVLAASGAVGVAALLRALRPRVAPRCRFALMMAAWFAAFGVVGCQLGWILRPLVGSPNIRVELVRADALSSNFLESFFGQIIPHIAHRGAVENE